MRVSIVIPAFNAAEFLDRTVQSVLRQTLPTWECVIVDDGSADETFAIASSLAESDSRIRVVRQENGGVAAARNRGLAECASDSDYAAFLDHDDEWCEDALESLVHVLLAAPEAGACHGLARRECSDGGFGGDRDLRRRVRIKAQAGGTAAVSADEPTSRAVLIWDNCITTTGCVLVRRSSIRSWSPIFDPQMAPLDDWDFYFRLASAHPILYIDRPVVVWHVHGSNTSRRVLAMDAATCRVRRKMLAEGALTADEAAVVRARLCRMARTIHRHRAQDYIRRARQTSADGNFAGTVGFIARAGGEYFRYLYSGIGTGDRRIGEE